MKESHVQVSERGTSFVGEDAVKLFAMASVRSAIGLYLKTGGMVKASRFHTPKRMLKTASHYTGKQYRIGRLGLAQAQTDLEQLIQGLKNTLPMVQR